uniref:ABC transporter domain-containing protein n=1 Tax=Kalanchoe fedtschenkoi TaxID=63787 RepID=A0A7N0UE86_KALFE
MMPPEQEATIPCNSTPGKLPGQSRTESTFSVHAEPIGPAENARLYPSDLSHDRGGEPVGHPVRTLAAPQSLRPVILKFDDVTYSITVGAGKGSRFGSAEPKMNRTVLNGLSGVVRPGELLAMLGPSGSGKTTLLTALAGRATGKVSGTITYNGSPFTSLMKRKTGFVMQDDVLYPHLTVTETLVFTALLRLPSQLTRAEKVGQVEAVVEELGLHRCRNNVVGGPLFRGISGGERKRVSIGQEMLVNPSVLFLDEPTSGLDSTTAQRIVATLKGLARGGRTVVTTIHQPSSRLYRLFDKVLVLCDGSPVYFGNAGRVMEYFGSIGYDPGFDLVNPADFLLDLANGIAPSPRQDDESFVRVENHEEQSATKQHLISAYRRNIYPLLKAEIHSTENDSSRIASQTVSSRTKNNDCERKWTASWWVQFKVLAERGLRERRHESYSGLRLFQVMSVAILAGLLWWHSNPSHVQDQVGLLFFFSIFWGFFPLFNAIFAFPSERPMLRKESASGMYRLSSYYFARTACDMPMELVLPTAFVTVTYWMGGLKPSLVTYLLTLGVVLFNVLVAQGLGLALGALLMEVKQGTTLASVTMLVFLLAGGYYIQHIPPFMAWLKYVSFSHYCYRLLVGVQFSKTEVYECGSGAYCRVMDYPGITCLELGPPGWDVAALFAMLIGFRLFAYVALRVRQIQKW